MVYELEECESREQFSSLFNVGFGGIKIDFHNLLKTKCGHYWTKKSL